MRPWRPGSGSPKSEEVRRDSSRLAAKHLSPINKYIHAHAHSHTLTVTRKKGRASRRGALGVLAQGCMLEVGRWGRQWIRPIPFHARQHRTPSSQRVRGASQSVCTPSRNKSHRPNPSSVCVLEWVCVRKGQVCEGPQLKTTCSVFCSCRFLWEKKKKRERWDVQRGQKCSPNMLQCCQCTLNIS